MNSLIDIELAYKDDPRLEHMRQSGIKFVPGTGTLEPKVMVIGEAPGKMENLEQKPFVGPAGELLHELMAEANLNLENSYLTNIVKYRPVDWQYNNRTPTSHEVGASMPYITSEWKAIGEPGYIITVGAVATGQFDSRYVTRKMRSIAGKPLEGENFTIVPMIHPAYILRNTATKPIYVAHWRWLGEYLANYS